MGRGRAGDERAADGAVAPGRAVTSEQRAEAPESERTADGASARRPRSPSGPPITRAGGQQGHGDHGSDPWGQLGEGHRSGGGRAVVPSSRAAHVYLPVSVGSHTRIVDGPRLAQEW